MRDRGNNLKPHPGGLRRRIGGLMPLLAAFPLLFSVVGCGGSGDGAVVVGDRVFSRAEAELYLKEAGAEKSSTDLRLGLVERLAERELFAREARKKGLERDPSVAWKLEQAAREILAGELLRREAPRPDEKALRERFEKSRERLRETIWHPAMIVARFRPADGDAAVDAARTRIGTALARLKEGHGFEETALVHSEDPATREKGGDIGPVRPEALEKEAAAAIAGLKPGEYSQPVVTATGVYIFKLLEAPAFRDPDFAHVKDRLADEAVREAQAALKTRLMEDVKYEVRKEMIESVTSQTAGRK